MVIPVLVDLFLLLRQNKRYGIWDICLCKLSLNKSAQATASFSDTIATDGEDTQGQAPEIDSTRTGWPDWLCKYISELEAIGGPAEFQAIVHKLTIQEALLGFPVGQVWDNCGF